MHYLINKGYQLWAVCEDPEGCPKTELSVEYGIKPGYCAIVKSINADQGVEYSWNPEKPLKVAIDITEDSEGYYLMSIREDG